MQARGWLFQVSSLCSYHGQRLYLRKCTSHPLCTREASKKNLPEHVKLSYNILKGSQPERPVLILHGLLASARNLDGVAKQLFRNTGRTVVTIDARNHGDSDHADEMGFEAMVSDVVNLLQEIKAKSCIPIGHSLGGRTAMTLALSRPELVDRLALIDISPIHRSRNAEVLNILQGMMEYKMPEGMALSEARRHANMDLSSAIPDQNVRDFLLTNLIERDGEIKWRVNLDVIMRSFRELGRIPTEYSAYTRGHALFIAAGLSDYIKEEDLPDIAKFFPQSEVRTIEGASHWVHYDKPKELLEILTEFVKG